MKKKLILKLIESNESPTKPSLIKFEINGKVEYTTSSIFTDKTVIIKPIAISDEEIKPNEKFLDFNDMSINTNNADISIDNEEFPAWKKIELLPEHFSNDILQLIVDGVLKDNDIIEVEWDKSQEGCMNFKSSFTPRFNHPILDSNGKAIISIPESNFKEVSKEELDSRRSSAYEYVRFTEKENVVHAFASAYDSAKKGIPHGVALEEYMKNNDRWIDKIMYSEEEVRTLIIEAIESFNDDVDEEVIISWFNHNKKK